MSSATTRAPLPMFRNGHSIVNLAATIGRRFGAQDTPASLGALGNPVLADALQRSHCVVLLLLDGVGCAQIEAIRPDGALAASRICELDSTFPSSTAPAVTSFATGLAPGAHAVTGWHLWSSEHQAIVRPLPLDIRGHPGQVSPDMLFDWSPLSARIDATMTVLQPASIADSAFSRHAFSGARRIGYSKPDALRRLIVEAASQARSDPHYVYAYLPQFDSSAHEYGWTSARSAQVLQTFDTLFAALSADLRNTDTLLLATADHGFIDVPPEQLLRLESFPAIAARLSAPLTGEPRVAFCHLRPGSEDEFASAVAQSPGFEFDCWESEALIEAGCFGPIADDSATLRQRVGSHTLIARDRFCVLQTLPGEKPLTFVGMHGGIHRDELRVGVSATLGGRSLMEN